MLGGLTWPLREGVVSRYSSQVNRRTNNKYEMITKLVWSLHLQDDGVVISDNSHAWSEVGGRGGKAVHDSRKMEKEGTKKLMPPAWSAGMWRGCCSEFWILTADAGAEIEKQWKLVVKRAAVSWRPDMPHAFSPVP